MTEENQLFHESLKKAERIFRFVGINVRRNTASKIKRNYLYLYIFNFLWLNSDVLGAISWFVDGAVHGKNFIELTYIAPCVTLSFLADIKSILLIIYNAQVFDLIDNLQKLEKKWCYHQQTEEKNGIVKKEIDFLNIVIGILNVFNIVLVVTFALSPLIMILITYLKTNEIELFLPFLILYPFDAYNIKYWPFIYVRQIWSEIVVVIAVCSADYFFYICCTHIRIQFKLLRNYIENIIPVQNCNNLEQNPDFHKHFTDIIKWHQELISCVCVLELIYAKSTLFNFMTSSIIICLTGFNVTTIRDLAIVFTFLSFLFMSLLQIFFLCFFGDMLMRSSTEISDAIYNSRWYSTSTVIGKNLFIVQIRSQTPCKLTAFGFSFVNLAAFTKILSTAWSYFALLKTVYD